MTSVTPQMVTTAAERQAFFDGLAAVRERIVPLVGAGLAAAARAPSSASLVSALQLAAGEEPRAEPLFATADRLAQAFGEAWVQEQVAAVVTAAELQPTPVLLALVRTPSRLILTTNYDLAVEAAAEQAGLEVEALTLADISRALEPAGDALRVLHLHGLAHRPDTIVLTCASYQAALADERLQQVLRALALGHRLLLLGHALDEREQHLRRDLLWAGNHVAASALAEAPAEHLLLTGRRDATADAALATSAGDLQDRAWVQLLAFDDPAGATASYTPPPTSLPALRWPIGLTLRRGSARSRSTASTCRSRSHRRSRSLRPGAAVLTERGRGARARSAPTTSTAETADCS